MRLLARRLRLVAMRTEDPNDGTGSDDFRHIIQALQDVLKREDSLFADPIVERIIVILGDGKSDEAQDLFASVKNRLRETAPDKADHLLNVVAAVIVPDGKPFTTAEELCATSSTKTSSDRRLLERTRAGQH